MKKNLLLGLLIILMTLSVTALSPSPEVDCCYRAEYGQGRFNEAILSIECPELKLNERTCFEIMDGGDRVQQEYLEQFTTGLETCYDDKGVNYPCDDPNLCYDGTGKVIDCINVAGQGRLDYLDVTYGENPCSTEAECLEFCAAYDLNEAECFGLLQKWVCNSNNINGTECFEIMQNWEGEPVEETDITQTLLLIAAAIVIIWSIYKFTTMFKKKK